MKYLLVVVIFLNSLLYAQEKEAIDSVAYYSNWANANIKENNYKNALHYTQKAILFCEAHSRINDQANQTFKLGKIYYDLKKSKDAIESFSESITLFEKLEPTANNAKAYYYLGTSHLNKGNYASAEICLNKCQAINNKLKISDSNEALSLQKGILYRLKKHYDIASSIFKNIIVKEDNPGIMDAKAEALYQMGEIEAIHNRNNLALNYFNKALHLNSNGENLEQKSNILFALSAVYDKMLDKNTAYSYLKQHLNLKERISILNNEKLGIDDYENFKETERLKKLALLKKQAKEKEKTENFSKLINILAIALISILSLLSLSLYKNNIIRNKTNLLLKEKNNELILAKEKAEKASKARSEFLSTVSHELRTPLNAINGITYLLLQEKPKKSQLDYLQSLKFSGDYLADFINDILEINKIESHKIEFESITFNLKELLENIQYSLKELASKNNNQFSLTIDPQIPTALLGDPTKLSQIFLNLINNALKFTRDGEVNVKAKMLSIDNDLVTIAFEVADTGIGIPEDKLKTVFESFSQGSIEINRKYGGTGLGLTIVKKLIKLLGGDIKLESTVGKGSKFSFDLQLKKSHQELPAEKSIKIIDNTVWEDKKVLLVEDNKINQMVSKKMLENKGILCEIIDNGEDAIKAVKENNYDLVLMDVHLPGINGTEATKIIREFDAKTPIIALTAISLNENREMLLSYGMDDVLTKPFVPDDFYAVIAKYI